ncbi:MAG: TolC family protein, partial [Clostridia bacterium]|nr:TolC family protein [Clostridia bacterium]
MKKILCLILAAMTAFPVSTAFATETAAEESTVQQMTFTVESATEYAMEHGKTLELAEAQLNKAHHERIQAQRSYNEFVSSGSSFEEALNETGYYFNAAKVQESSAERNIETTRNNITVDIKSKFYTCLNYKAKIEVARERLESAVKQLEYAQTKYEQGSISLIELKTFKLAVSSAQMEYNSVVRDSELALTDFKNTLDIPKETKITLIGEFVLPELTYADDKTAAELAKSQSAYLSIQDGKELAELRYKVARGWYGSNEVGYHIEFETYTASMIDLDESEKTLNYSISEIYNTLLALKESLGVMNESVELQYDIAKSSSLQYDLGMITATEYVEAEQDYYEAK